MAVVDSPLESMNSPATDSLEGLELEAQILS